MKLFCIFLFMFISHTLAIRGIARRMNETELLDKRDRGTWYTGQGLKNAACYGRNGRKPLSPSVNDMIGAMAMNDLEKCYKCMEITNIQNKVQVVVKIVDKCAACKINRAVDLTPKAFSLLSKGSLDIGVLNISFKPVSCRGRISSLLKNL